MEIPTTQSRKVLYTGKTRTTGGRNHGMAQSSDGHLDIRLSEPNAAGTGTNPEQLFAAAWSACYEGAMGTAARRLRVVLPENTTVDAEVDLCLEKGEFLLQARLHVNIPEIDRKLARQILDDAHHICPYSKAIQGNVTVETNLV